MRERPKLPAYNSRKYHRQQNKFYPQKCLLAYFVGTLGFIVANLPAHNNISQICYSGQISLQSAAVNCIFFFFFFWQWDTFGGNIYFAGDGTSGITCLRPVPLGQFFCLAPILGANPAPKIGGQSLPKWGLSPILWPQVSQ